MATLVYTSEKVQTGTAWTGTAPGAGNPTVSGTVSSATDWSDHIKSATLALASNMVDFTTFGDGGWEVAKPGLKSGTLTVDFNADFSSSVDATFGPAILADTLFYIDLMPTSSSRSSTNPSYVVAAYATSYDVGGAVGDRASVTVNFKVTGKPGRLTS